MTDCVDEVQVEELSQKIPVNDKKKNVKVKYKTYR